ncbi:MAG TPA: hypothetical protein DCM14_06100 [Clostridiales bacterium UBA8153]|nr:hypothetical protein [Clostridiales bacterium UBA8153]
MNRQSLDPGADRPRNVAIIAAGGSGVRMGGLKKQFLPLAGLPVVVRSIRPFQDHPLVDAIVLVVPPGDIPFGQSLCSAYGLAKVKGVVEGGRSRSESVRSGLEAARSFHPDVILVHDGVRPLVRARLIDRVLEAATRHGAAVPAMEIYDSLKRVACDRVESSVPRERMRAVQTPQGFQSAWLYGAYSRPVLPEATDDAGLVEACGYPIAVLPGDRDNVKITSEDDLKLAGRLLADPGVAAGIGYDVHRLEAGRPFILGGVKIPSELGLTGHSDADVIVHAVIDALLGAAGLPDIGQQFPDTDPRFCGADSTGLLEQAVKTVAGVGCSVLSIDVTVVCERPRLAPHIPDMKARLAPILRVDPSRIGIKATTQEGMGFVGRAEGVCAWCVTLVQRH